MPPSAQAGSIELATREQLDHFFAVTVRAPFFIIQRALPLLADGGRIINISSSDTRIAVPEELVYSMTKGAINVLGRTLATALGWAARHHREHCGARRDRHRKARMVALKRRAKRNRSTSARADGHEGRRYRRRRSRPH
ncbi:MAG: SDR family oxidoreductase [Solirubrobacteraceae bacterium]